MSIDLRGDLGWYGAWRRWYSRRDVYWHASLKFLEPVFEGGKFQFKVVGGVIDGADDGRSVIQVAGTQINTQMRRHEPDTAATGELAIALGLLGPTAVTGEGLAAAALRGVFLGSTISRGLCRHGVRSTKWGRSGNGKVQHVDVGVNAW